MTDKLNDDQFEKLLDANGALLEKLNADTRHDEEIGALQVALDNTLRERDALQAALDNAADTIAGLQRIAAELNAENVGLKQQIARLEVNNRAAERENERLEGRLTDLIYEPKERG